LNCTGNGALPEVWVYNPFSVKFPIGNGTIPETLTNEICVEIFDPPEFAAVRLIDQFPEPSIATSFCNLFPIGIHVLFPVTFFAPHDHDVGVFVEVSFNEIPSGGIPDIGETVNDATGGTIKIHCRYEVWGILTEIIGWINY
jgi:hypothetical protein